MDFTYITAVLVIVTSGEGEFPNGFQYERQNTGPENCAIVMAEEDAFMLAYGSESDQYCLLERGSPRPKSRPQALIEKLEKSNG